MVEAPADTAVSRRAFTRRLVIAALLVVAVVGLVAVLKDMSVGTGRQEFRRPLAEPAWP
jgi:hypothetical protein